uniref:Uncharacterized protein n=1 Tax=Inoviridae sp. ctFNB4 TaxID=2823614 RepID=A0A8S5LBS7_9VIRU|nr:MAG TPA: hypothetical protein [Inoviridae sp. ctFNB4]
MILTSYSTAKNSIFQTKPSNFYRASSLRPACFRKIPKT